jgi:HPt (histidine-containing phosphotransfer) domain-containing protein
MLLDQGMRVGVAHSRELMPEGLDHVPAVTEPIDMKHLGRYTLGDTSLEREVLDLFAGQIPMTIAALKGASTEKDWQTAAHTLKGSGRAVGAWRLADLALQAEKVAVPGDRSARTKIIHQIEAAASDVARFIGSFGLQTAR